MQFSLIGCICALAISVPVSMGLSCNTCVSCWEREPGESWLGDAINTIGKSVEADGAKEDFANKAAVEAKFGTDCTDDANLVTTAVSDKCVKLLFTLKEMLDGKYQQPLVTCTILGPLEYLFKDESTLQSDGVSKTLIDDYLSNMGDLTEDLIESDMEKTPDVVVNVSSVYAKAELCDDNDGCNTKGSDGYTVQLEADLGFPYESDFDDSSSDAYDKLMDLLGYLDGEIQGLTISERGAGSANYSIKDDDGDAKFKYTMNFVDQTGWSNSDIEDIWDYVMEYWDLDSEDSAVTRAEERGLDTKYFELLKRNDAQVKGSSEDDGKNVRDNARSLTASLGAVAISIMAMKFRN